jgi:hypothetical protein
MGAGAFMRVPIVSILIAVAALPLAAQVIYETPVSDVTYFHNQEKIQAAGSDGEDFLVAGTRGITAYAHRVTASGQILDGTGIRVAIPPQFYEPNVLGIFWAGDAYTIVLRTITTTWVARIDRDGHLVAPAHQILSGPVFNDAASNNRRIVLAGSKLAVLDLQGNVIESDIGLPLQPGTIGEGFHRIASNGDGFMVSWGTSSPTESEVAIAALDRNGHPIGASALVPGIGFTQVVASNGSDYVVVYQIPNGTHFAQRVSVAGELLERFTLPRLGTQITRILWNGASYVVGVLNAIQLALATPSVFRLDRNGAPMESVQSVAPESVAASGDPVVMATNGRQVAMFWPDGGYDPVLRWFGGFLGNDLKIAEKFPIGVTATLQVSPSVASDGRNLFIVWEESDAIYGSLLSLASGQRGARIKLSSKTAHAPRAIWDGHAYVVAWRSGSASLLTTAQVSIDGAIVQADEKPVFTNCVDGFDIVSDGGDTIVAVASGCWTTSKNLAVTRVHRDGTPDPPLVLGSSTGFPRVAWSGSQYLLAWYEVTNATGLDYPVYRGNVRAARLSPSLTVLDTAPLTVDVAFDEENSLPVVASDGRDFMIAWTHDDQFNPSLRARSVSAGGALGDVVALGPGTTNSMIWDGHRFALAFTTPSADVLLRRIGTDTASLISGTADAESAVAIISGGGTVVHAAYVRTATEPLYGAVPRVFVKSVSGGPRTRAIR